MRLYTSIQIVIYNLVIKESKKTGGSMLNESILNSIDNPIPELINDDIYDLLSSRGLINEKSVRDYIIKKQFKDMRESKVRASEAIDSLRAEYPYLQFDTIRKIVYQS